MRGFRGADFFLSNAYPSPVELEGKFYPTVWHAFAAACAATEGERYAVELAASPAVAAALARDFRGVDDCWDDSDIAMMATLLRQKFELYPELAAKLVDTGTQHLVSEEPSGSTWWGVHNGRGKNVLGELLTDERRFFRQRVRDAK